MKGKTNKRPGSNVILGRFRGAGAEEWIAGRRESPFFVEKPVRRHVDIVLVYDPARDILLDTEAIELKTSPRDVAVRIARTVREPNRSVGAGRRIDPPKRLRVDDEALAEALRRAIPAEIEVVVGPTPEMDILIDKLATHVRGSFSPAAAENRLAALPDALLEAFFSLTDEYFTAAPWTFLDDSQILRVDVPALGREGQCLSVIGALGESHGLLVFDSLDGYLRMLRIADVGDAQQRNAHEAPFELLSVNFDDARELPPSWMARAKAKGWRFTRKGGFPWLARSDGRHEIPLREDDYALAVACLAGVLRLLDEHPGEFTGVLKQPVIVETGVEQLSNQPRARVVAPHPEAFWEWGESALQALRLRDVDALIERFQAAQSAAGEAADVVETRCVIVDALYEYKCRYLDEPMNGVTRDMLEGFMFDYLPRKKTVPDEFINAVPGALEAFVAWLRSPW